MEKLNYAKLMINNPTLLDTKVNHMGQTVNFYDIRVEITIIYKNKLYYREKRQLPVHWKDSTIVGIVLSGKVK